MKKSGMMHKVIPGLVVVAMLGLTLQAIGVELGAVGPINASGKLLPIPPGPPGLPDPVTEVVPTAPAPPPPPPAPPVGTD